MAYELGYGETEEQALRRCAREQFDRAIAELTEGLESDPVTAVHDARKALKKVRSALRLARGGIASSERRAVNAAVRDAGRRLSAARDAEVMLQAVDGLSERYAGQLPKRTFNAVRRHFNAQATAARASLDQTDAVVEELKSLRVQVDEWRFRRSGWPAIGEGLQRSYKRGRRAHRRAERDPTTENLHEWRKRAKDLWYHVRLLEPVATPILRGHAEAAHELSDLLGDDHDLAVLRESLVAAGGSIRTDVDSVITLIDHRREQLQAQAMRAGARLYAEKPKAFVRRIRAYWKVWRSEPPPEEMSEPAQLPGRVPATN